MSLTIENLMKVREILIDYDKKAWCCPKCGGELTLWVLGKGKPYKRCKDCKERYE